MINNHGQRNSPEARNSVVVVNSEGVVERSDAERKSEYVRNVLRPHSTPATLLWLDANYEMADGVCIPRSTLYAHYVHFCAENGLQPVNAASFGKIIRQQFPLLTTRRLGTRGQSRYHYYGIAIRETSTYFDASYSKKGAACNSETRRDVNRQTGICQSRYKFSPLLPDFPSVRDIALPAGIPRERVTSFLMMYRTHCHRIYDTIMRASLEEVQNFLLHFWQGMPSHLVGILGTNVVVNMVGVCDSILYRTICNVLMPTVLQSVPDNLLHIIRKFALELEVWLHMALEDLPTVLRNVKLSLAHNFSQMLKRQTSLNHLCQAAQMVIYNTDLTNQMLQDLRRVDIPSICRQTVYTMEKNGASVVAELIVNTYQEFEHLLEGRATIETYGEWLESIVDRCVIQRAGGNGHCLRHLARQFLLLWSMVGTRVIRDMTLHSAPSFGSFHLLHLLFDDYVIYLLDVLHSELQAKEMLRNVSCDYPPELDAHWESTDTDDTMSCDPSRDGTTLYSDYSQLENVADDAQDIPEMNHQGAVVVDYQNHMEPYTTSYENDSECRNSYKISGRSCVFPVFNQHAMDSEDMAEDETISSKDERSMRYTNSTVLYYNSNDCNFGICSQHVASRHDHDELTAAGAYYHDHSGLMQSISANIYHSYAPNASCHYNRSRIKDGISGMKNHLHS